MSYLLLRAVCMLVTLRLFPFLPVSLDALCVWHRLMVSLVSNVFECMCLLSASTNRYVLFRFPDYFFSSTIRSFRWRYNSFFAAADCAECVCVCAQLCVVAVPTVNFDDPFFFSVLFSITKFRARTNGKLVIKFKLKIADAFIGDRFLASIVLHMQSLQLNSILCEHTQTHKHGARTETIVFQFNAYCIRALCNSDNLYSVLTRLVITIIILQSFQIPIAHQ